jgi:hypothetical protein
MFARFLALVASLHLPLAGGVSAGDLDLGHILKGT